MTVWVQRSPAGDIKGVFANLQPGLAEEPLDDNDVSVKAFRSPVVPPVSVTPRQARIALLGAGLLDAVQSAVDTAGGATKITWEYATEINRDDPFITTIATSLGLTSAAIDLLFQQAAQV